MVDYLSASYVNGIELHKRELSRSVQIRRVSATGIVVYHKGLFESSAVVYRKRTAAVHKASNVHASVNYNVAVIYKLRIIARSVTLRALILFVLYASDNKFSVYGKRYARLHGKRYERLNSVVPAHSCMSASYAYTDYIVSIIRQKKSYLHRYCRVFTERNITEYSYRAFFVTIAVFKRFDRIA